jgi:hypothetical protein
MTKRSNSSDSRVRVNEGELSKALGHRITLMEAQIKDSRRAYWQRPGGIVAMAGVLIALLSTAIQGLAVKEQSAQLSTQANIQEQQLNLLSWYFGALDTVEAALAELGTHADAIAFAVDTEKAREDPVTVRATVVAQIDELVKNYDKKLEDIKDLGLMLDERELESYRASKEQLLGIAHSEKKSNDALRLLGTRFSSFHKLSERTFKGLVKTEFSRRQQLLLSQGISKAATQ